MGAGLAGWVISARGIPHAASAASGRPRCAARRQPSTRSGHPPRIIGRPEALPRVNKRGKASLDRGFVKTRVSSVVAPRRPSRAAQDRRRSSREGFDASANCAWAEFSNGDPWKCPVAEGCAANGGRKGRWSAALSTRYGPHPHPKTDSGAPSPVLCRDRGAMGKEGGRWQTLSSACSKPFHPTLPNSYAVRTLPPAPMSRQTRGRFAR